LFLKTFSQFIKKYAKGYKLKFALIEFFSLLMGGFEFLGLALIFPFVMLIAGNNDILHAAKINFLFERINLLLDTKTLAIVLCCTIILIYILKNIFMIFCTKYQNDTMANFQTKLYVTNIIPFFGPYLGAVPCAFLILLVNPMQCLYFIIFILQIPNSCVFCCNIFISLCLLGTVVL